MSILLAGGAGYIGSHTAVELLSAGYDIVIADNYSNSKPEAVRRIKQITGKTFPVYEVDVCDGEALSKVFEKEHIDTVIHFAGLKAVGESVAQPIRYYRNNLDSTLTLLETMKKYDAHNIIFSSSATVYGDPDEVPIKETAPVGRCTNPYGWTKYMCEQILRDYVKADPSWSVALLRYFNPVGAHPSGLIGEDPKGIPNNLMPYISQTAIGRFEYLRVFGDDYNTPDGTGVRDYIHVVDLARGHVAAISYMDSHPGGLIFNLGTGRGCSVLELVHAFEKANKLTVPYKIVGRRAGDIDECYCSPEKSRRELGWTAQYNVEDMCRDSWHWQTMNPNGYRDE